MICPKCGRTIEIGEICQCQQLDVARRQMELEKEQKENNENQKIQYNKSIKEKSEKMQAASRAADEAMDNAANMGKSWFECFKDMNQIDKLYVNRADTKMAIVLMIIHLVLNTILVYLALTKSPLSLIFSFMSVFTGRNNIALLFGSLCISALPMLSKLGILKFKAEDNCLYEVTSEYIYTIPVTLLGIILMLLSGVIGIIVLLPIISFGTMWTEAILEKYSMDKNKAQLCLTINSVVISILAIIICRLIA